MKKNNVVLVMILLIASFAEENLQATDDYAFFEINLRQQRPYTGKFVLNSGQVTLTLMLTQYANKQVTGTLKSSNGTVFQVKGAFEGGGVATGTCTGNSHSSNSQAAYQNQQEQQQVPQNQYQNQYQNQQQVPQNQYQNNQNNQNYSQQQSGSMGIRAGAGSNIGTHEVGDQSWGFRFIPPAGWVHKKTNTGILLGHNTIAGMIIVMPHTSQSMQQMQHEMMKGIQEEGTSLRPEGNLVAAGKNALSVDYAGVVSGQQVKAKGYGVLSPYGGGAYILALATPDKMSKDLVAAARTVAGNMRFVKANSSGLIQFFADTWVSTTTNTSSYVYLYADGTYSLHDESGYSGNFTDGGGNNTGNWGAGGQQNGRGRWSVQGNKDQGQIISISPSGERTVYAYRVHMENGQKYYSEYFFNGTLYHRKNKYDE